MCVLARCRLAAVTRKPRQESLAGGASPLLFPELRAAPTGRSALAQELAAFAEFGRASAFTTTACGSGPTRRVVDTFVNEFWTSGQRRGHDLHEISYRACFKPQLPAFFVDRLSRPDDVVYDPFMGRGTTPLEAALRGRRPAGNDVNPLSAILLRPRLRPPTATAVADRLAALDLRYDGELPEELLVFFHPETLRELCALRAQLLAAPAGAAIDPVLDWIRMVTINRLTGHSPGFLSVYTMPPNQAVSVAVQRRINERRGQVPPPRSLRDVVLKKSKAMLGAVTDAERARLATSAAQAALLTGPAAATPALATASVQLVVTSPPFLDVVQYRDDNWLRCWFCGIDPAAVPVTMARTVPAWAEAMGAVLRELHRVVRPGGHVAFEVGEVRRGTVRLEEVVIPVAVAAGFEPMLVLVNDQQFTKTANCWGITNNRHGTNSNRVVVLHRA